MRRTVLFALLGLLGAVLACSTEAQPEENGVPVNSYYRAFNPGRRDGGLGGPRPESWHCLAQAPSRRYRIGVLFPNQETKDLAWKPARVGIEAQAKLLGISVEKLSSDSYEAVAQHQGQFRELVRRGVDGILLAPIHYTAMDALVEEAVGKGIPVITLGNDIHTPVITAKVMRSAADAGRQLGEFVLRDAAAKRKPSLTIAFFPGPINSSWAPATLKTFLSVVRRFPGELTILPPAWGTPQLSIQRELVARVLEENPTIDYVIGNAVAATAAAELLQSIGRTHDTSVLSAYYSPMINPSLESGAITASAWERAEGIGRIAVDLMVRTLEGERPGRDFPFRVETQIHLIDNPGDVRPVPCR